MPDSRIAKLIRPSVIRHESVEVHSVTETRGSSKLVSKGDVMSKSNKSSKFLPVVLILVPLIALAIGVGLGQLRPTNSSGIQPLTTATSSSTTVQSTNSSSPKASTKLLTVAEASKKYLAEVHHYIPGFFFSDKAALHFVWTYCNEVAAYGHAANEDTAQKLASKYCTYDIGY
jgi:hypothetical protein